MSNFEKRDSRNSEVENATEQVSNFRRQQSFRTRSCPFSGKDALGIDYKDIKVLSKFLSERGKIIPSRVTSVCYKKQRELSKAIKRARFLALIPYVND